MELVLKGKEVEVAHTR